MRLAARQASDRPALGRPRVILLSFLVVILLGAALLWLPISARDGYTRPIHALFVATSATAVTGLTPLDPNVHFSPFGQVVILLLIQFGGVGIASASVVLFTFSGRGVGLGDRLLIQESLGASQLGGVVALSFYILRVTLAIEAAGFVLLALRFVPELGLGRGLWVSLFQSVSTFCNAGFDLFGSARRPFVGPSDYRSDVYVNLVLAALIFLGGVSFPVLAELARYRSTRRLSMFAKLILVTNVGLLLFGMAAYLVIEWSHADTLGPLPVWNKALTAFFGSTALRTAGIAMIAPSALHTSTQVIAMALMFIGASSESTGGGIKANTFGVLMGSVWDTLRGREKIHLFGRRLAPETVYKALTVTTVAALAVGVLSLALSWAEEESYLAVLWETVSAFGTVGYTLDLTPNLSSFGMLVVIFTMYWGRVGPVTLVAALVQREEPEPLTYPVERIPIG
jgi:trk system potassium uptake protein TrkH